ncbi:MAG: ribosomal RNA small subunit methyltransferase A [Rickettsia sp.]|nr:ribosomal RNA small subunit methyltransferase A [Rickettsia sp.]
MSSLFKIIKNYNILPKYFLGQNFLLDQNIIKKIIDSANIKQNSHVLEIGPGIGSLTKYIVKEFPRKVTLIEYDKQFSKILDDYNDVDIIYDDVLKIDMSNIFSNQEDNIIIANLPYYISSKILMKIFAIKNLSRFVIMIQKEVGDKILSKHNQKSYGKLSVISQILYKIRKICDVNSASFYPRPKVTSSVLIFDYLQNNICQYTIKNLLSILKHSFAFRRKLLINNLESLNFPYILEIFDEMKIDQRNTRAENLSPSQYLDLANKISLY